MSQTRVSFHGVAIIEAEASSRTGTHWVALRFDGAEIVAFLPNAEIAQKYAEAINEANAEAKRVLLPSEAASP